MWLIVIAGVIAAVHILPKHAFLRRNVTVYIVLAAAAVNWLYFMIVGGVTLKTPQRSAAGIAKVVTTGIYAKVRHPIYSADIILAWAIFLFLPAATTCSGFSRVS